MSLVSSYRCSNCNLNRPLDQEYRTCPKCCDATWLNKCDSDFLLSKDGALSITRHIAFEKYYESHNQSTMQEHIDALTGNDILYPDAILGG